jgi:hypothetical protein
MGEKVCFSGERILLLRLLVEVLIERALGRRFCLGGESLAGLQDVRIDSRVIDLKFVCRGRDPK